MINRIKAILDKFNLDDYKVVENKTVSEERFFIKNYLDMIRSKDVQHFKITVYKDFEDDGKKYRGSSTFDVHPTNSDKEIQKLIEDNYFAASFVKNEYYELPAKCEEKANAINSRFSELPLCDWMPKLSEALFKEDKEKDGGINSAEIFLNKEYRRIINSKGTDVSYEIYSGMIEFITYWKAEEEIELYKMLTFSDYKPEYIEESVKEMLNLSKARAEAKNTIASGKYKVILKNDPVKEVLSYYVYHSDAEAVYKKISTLKAKQAVQGEEVNGDFINLDLDPCLENSIYSAPYDSDGVALKKANIIENGILNSYHGDFRHSYYLNTKTTGSINNAVIKGGSKTINEMENEPYVELISFSDFQLDQMTGDFGGEIRLGFYFDGEKKIPITGGSLSGNIKDIQSNMYLSKEVKDYGGFIGPKAIEMFNVSIAGK